MEAEATKWRVLLELTYVRPADFGDLHVGEGIWLEDNAGRPFIAKVREILPADDSEHPAGTLLADLFK